MIRKLPIIGVLGSHIDPHTEKASALGKMIAEKGYHLLTGGGGGAMTAVARSFTQVSTRSGLCIGIVPIEEKEDAKVLQNLSNPYIEVPIVTQLSDKAMRASKPLSLNTVNILTSDVIVVLPGLDGTKMETSLAMVYKKPIIFFGTEEEFAKFPSEPIVAQDIKEISKFIMRTLAD